MISTGFPSKKEIAELSAAMLLDVNAVHFNSQEPFTLASGLLSPTYIDCRKLISFPRVRSALMDFLTCTVLREAGFEAFTSINGATFYNLEPNRSFLTLSKGTPLVSPNTISSIEGYITIFDPGYELYWQVL